MSFARTLKRFRAEDRGTSAAEFALVVPITMLFLFGIIDAGLFAWRINEVEKATQMGTRLAVVTDPVASGLTTASYVNTTVGATTLTQGDVIPAGALGLITCNSASCSCTTGPCPATLGYSATAFNGIRDRMRRFDSRITAANIVVEYRGSGLGFAGDPNGMEIAPLTTVRVQNLRFQPLTLMLFGQSFTMPAFSYSLPMEDGSGTRSN
jgi:hypothetical protein